MFFVTSNSSEDGHTVAYAIDIAKRTTCAGPLDEHAVEFEVATVKEAIPLSQAGPSAEVPPPDPTEAEPGSESTDFQVAAEDGVFATPAQRADAFLNGMAAPPQPARNGAFVTPAQSVDVALDRMAEPLAALEAREPSQREPLQPPCLRRGRRCRRPSRTKRSGGSMRPKWPDDARWTARPGSRRPGTPPTGNPAWQHGKGRRVERKGRTRTSGRESQEHEHRIRKRN